MPSVESRRALFAALILLSIRLPACAAMKTWCPFFIGNFVERQREDEGGMMQEILGAWLHSEIKNGVMKFFFHQLRGNSRLVRERAKVVSQAWPSA